MADEISSLPTAHEKPSEIDFKAMREVFGGVEEINKKIRWKELILVLLAFIVLILPFTDTTLESILPSGPVVLISKTLIFVIVIVVLQFYNNSEDSTHP